MQTDLYRHFDAEGRLLYVGISFGAIARLQQHRDNRAGWVSKIVRVEVQKFRTRKAAERAEARAIRTEKPLHNKRIPKLPAPKPRPVVHYDHPTGLQWACGRAHEYIESLSPEDKEKVANGIFW